MYDDDDDVCEVTWQVGRASEWRLAGLQPWESIALLWSTLRTSHWGASRLGNKMGKSDKELEIAALSGPFIVVQAMIGSWV